MPEVSTQGTMVSGGDVAGQQAVTGAVEQHAGARRPSLLKKLAPLIPLALLLIYFVKGAQEVKSIGGLEAMVRRADFVSTLTGALLIREGHGPSLYNLETQRDAQNEVLAGYNHVDLGNMLPYNHLPFEALFITPLVALPYPLVFGLWTLLMALAVWLSLRTMQRALPMPGAVLPIAVLVAISYQPLFRSFMLGQNSPLVLLGLCGTYAAIRRGQDGLAGAALLLVALKPQILPIVLLALLLQRHWRALATFLGLLAALCIAVMLVLSPAWPLDYARLLLGVSNWSDTGAIDPAIMHNWRGFATNLFASWAPSAVTPVFLALTLASAALLVYFALMIGGKTLGTRYSVLGTQHNDLFWALTGILAVLTSLHLNPHDLTLLIFPAWILGAYVVSAWFGKGQSRNFTYIIWAAYALIPLAFYTGLGASYPGLVVVPDVLLMSLAALLLARQLRTGEPHPA
ncbi:MAG: glycosyltransferase family 87 protein [Chloroflexia bacterium]